jgi:hypothetical protein
LYYTCPMKTIYEWIPSHVGNRQLIGGMDLLRTIGAAGNRLPFLRHVKTARREEHYRQNSLLLEKRQGAGNVLPAPENGFLEYQNRCGQILYGKTNVAFAGCEIIAFYNLLKSLHRDEPLPALIRETETNGMIHGARWGTSPLSQLRSLQKRGISVRSAWSEPEFTAVLNSCESFLLTLYNDKDDLRKMIHTVCVTVLPPADTSPSAVPSFDTSSSDTSATVRRYRIHNAAGNGPIDVQAGTMQELMAAFPSGRARAILLIGAGPDVKP